MCLKICSIAGNPYSESDGTAITYRESVVKELHGPYTSYYDYWNYSTVRVLLIKLDRVVNRVSRVHTLDEETTTTSTKC